MAKLYVTKVIAEPGQGGMMTTRKRVALADGNGGLADVGWVVKSTVMRYDVLDKYMRSRGWHYAGHKAGGFEYHPGPKAVALVISDESESAS